MANYDDETIKALATLRLAVRNFQVDVSTVAAFNVLDDAGVFTELDEMTGYEDATETLSRMADDSRTYGV